MGGVDNSRDRTYGAIGKRHSSPFKYEGRPKSVHNLGVEVLWTWRCVAYSLRRWFTLRAITKLVWNDRREIISVGKNSIVPKWGISGQRLTLKWKPIDSAGRKSSEKVELVRLVYRSRCGLHWSIWWWRFLRHWWQKRGRRRASNSR